MRSAITVFSVFLLLVSGMRAVAEPLRIAVAANFAATARKLSDDFQSNTGTPVSLSVASTGVLVTQILHGAPFHLFLSADVRGPSRLAAAGRAVANSQHCYAIGKLVLLGGELADIGQDRARLAIANPETAPYGRAAMEVLSRAGGNRINDDQLVRGSSVLQAYQFWVSGGAEQALVAASLAGDSGVTVPPQWHKPLEQHAILLTPEHTQAMVFLSFLKSGQAAATIIDAGYRACT